MRFIIHYNHAKPVCKVHELALSLLLARPPLPLKDHAYDHLLAHISAPPFSAPLSILLPTGSSGGYREPEKQAVAVAVAAHLRSNCIFI